MVYGNLFDLFFICKKFVFFFFFFFFEKIFFFFFFFFFFFSGGWAHGFQARLARVLNFGNELLYYPGDQA